MCGDLLAFRPCSKQLLDSAARAGSVSTCHGPINTPAAVLYSRRGGPMSLTPDILAALKHRPGAFGVDVLHFLANPSPDIVAASGLGGHGFLAVPKTLPMLASNRDPTMYEYGAKPSSDQGAYVSISSGATVVTPAKYMEAVAALRPDLYVALCDEITHDAKPKKITQTLKRSEKWLDACLDLHATHSLEGVSGMLAPVGGGSSASERSRAAQQVADKPVTGFALSGFSTGEARGSERASLLVAVIQHLPANKLRFLPGTLTPGDILDCVAAGVDLFDGAYPVQVTAEGYALCFPLQPGQSPPAGPPDAGSGRDDTKMNLWSTAYRLDKAGLVPGCTCYTCVRHSRAYVHHLLQTNEMLGEVLLEVHNTHHFQAFMAAIRGALEAGSFAEYHAWFSSGRHYQEEQVQGEEQHDSSITGRDLLTEMGQGGLGGIKRAAWAVQGAQEGVETSTNSKQARTQ